MEILIVAKWWKLDPDIVKHWTFLEFEDRREFMDLQYEMQKE